jgi:hypothetical protein
VWIQTSSAVTDRLLQETAFRWLLQRGDNKRCQVREALDPILTRHSHALFICVHPRSSAVGYSGGDEAKRSSNTSDSIARTARNSLSAPVFLEASTQSVTHTGSHVVQFATFELFAAAFR